MKVVFFVLVLTVLVFSFVGKKEAYLNNPGEGVDAFMQRMCPSLPGANVYNCGTRNSDGSTVYCIDGGSRSCEATFGPGICTYVDSCTGSGFDCTNPNAEVGQYFCFNDEYIAVCDPANSGFPEGWMQYASCNDCLTYEVSNTPDLCYEPTQIYCYKCDPAMNGNVQTTTALDTCPAGWSEEPLSTNDCLPRITCYSCGSDPGTVISVERFGSCLVDETETPLTTEDCGGQTTCSDPFGTIGQYFCFNDEYIAVCDPVNSGFANGWMQFQACNHCANYAVGNSPDICIDDPGTYCYQCNQATDEVDVQIVSGSCPTGWQETPLTIQDCNPPILCYSCGNDPGTVISITRYGECEPGETTQVLTVAECNAPPTEPCVSMGGTCRASSCDLSGDCAPLNGVCPGTQHCCIGTCQGAPSPAPEPGDQCLGLIEEYKDGQCKMSSMLLIFIVFIVGALLLKILKANKRK